MVFSNAQEDSATYLRGLLNPEERKTSWQWAEVSREAMPYGFQHLPGGADWEADAVRDELRVYKVPHLGDADVVLVIDETEFLKNGRHSAGVAHQYRGTAADRAWPDRVFLGNASRLGHALLNRELFLPEAWTNDRNRCRRVGILDERRFATKPQLAKEMLHRALAAGVPAAWVTSDSVYGNNRRPRM